MKPIRMQQYARYAPSWQRSATAPETMVAQAAQKQYWKKNMIQS